MSIIILEIITQRDNQRHYVFTDLQVVLCDFFYVVKAPMTKGCPVGRRYKSVTFSAPFVKGAFLFKTTNENYVVDV